MPKVTDLSTILNIKNTTSFVVADSGYVRRLNYSILATNIINTATTVITNLFTVTTVTATGESSLEYSSATKVFTFKPPLIYALTTATTSTVGGVKIGAGISITPDGRISASSSGFATTSTLVSGTSTVSLSSTGTLTLPVSGDIVRNGVSVLGGGGYSRTTCTAVTGSLYPGTTGTTFFAGFKSYALLKISTSVSAWVRLYTTSAARSSDSLRAQTADPTPGSGVIAEVITSGAQTVLMTPGVFGFNDDTTTTSTIYAAVTNLTAGQQSVTVILTLLKLEA